MSDTTRERNRRLVLEQISLRRQVSRQEIVDTTGLSKAAISLIVAELIENLVSDWLQKKSESLLLSFLVAALTFD